jgi:hypothetical protein
MASTSYHGDYDSSVYSPDRDRLILPWVGVGLIALSLILPYVDVDIGFLSTEYAGYELLEDTVVRIVDYQEEYDSGEEKEYQRGSMAYLLVKTAPAFLIVIGLISIGLLLKGKHPRSVGLLPLIYLIIVILLSFTGSFHARIIGDLTVHSEMAGIGFYVGCASGILLCLRR